MTATRTRVRRATLADIPFLVECIIAAEKSGTDRLSYCTLFGLPEAEFRGMLVEMLEEDVPGQELCVSGFLLAERDGQPAGAICGWVEGTGAKASALVKGSLLMHFMGRERITAASPRLKLMEGLSLARTPGALQLESVYVDARHRGQGLCARLLDEHQALARRDHPAVQAAQIILAKGNGAALAAYEKAGFAIAAERSSPAPQVLALLPSATRVLMDKPLGPAAAPGA